MIKKVDWQPSTWADLPYKFEAGTANIAEAIGLGSPIDFLSPLVSPASTRSLVGRGGHYPHYESKITAYALKQMQKIKGLEIYGPTQSQNRIGVISFNLADIPPHDLASILDSRGIAIRTGHHCAMPLHEKLHCESSARISLAIYNTKKNIDEFISGLKSALTLLSS